MKKIILSIVAIFLMGSMVMAQNARHGDKTPDPKVRAERMTERMVKEYSLNDTQKKQLLEANLAMLEKMGNMPMTHKSEARRGKADAKGCCCSNDKSEKKSDKECKNADRKEGKKAQMTDEQRSKMKAEKDKKREEMQAVRTVYAAQLQKIMTKEQYNAYTQNLQNRQQDKQAKRRK